MAFFHLLVLVGGDGSAAMHRLSNPIPQPERECDICGFTTAKADIIGVDSAGPASKQGAVDAVSRDCALPKKIPKVACRDRWLLVV